MNKPTNKQESQTHDTDSGAGPAETRPTAEKTVDTTEQTSIRTNQLPELWDQTTGPDGSTLNDSHQNRWNDKIETMFQRCETWPQYAELAGTVAGMPRGAWGDWHQRQNQAIELLQQATPGQLIESLQAGQPHPLTGWWSTSMQILTYANYDQLTAVIIEQLPWNHTVAWAATQMEGTEEREQLRHVVDVIQQTLLENNEHAWEMFLGIVETGYSIGDVCQIVIATENQNRPD